MLFAGMTAPRSILVLHVLLLILFASSPCNGKGHPTHDITAILAASPDFTDFSAALAAANLTGEIDGRQPITVLAVDKAAMSRLQWRGLPSDRLGRVLSLHVLLDYFGDAKLRALNGASPTQAASLFQASGAAAGAAGMVSNTVPAGVGDGRKGVGFAAADAGGHTVFYEKSVKESPYDIAVLQVSDAMDSPSAEGRALPSPAPVAAPAPAPAGTLSPKNQTATPPQPAGAPSPKNQTAPAPSPKPAVSPSPKNQTAPPPKPASREPAPAPATPADAPEADEQPPADENGQHNDGTGDTVAPWSVFAAVAAVVLLLW